ncbi:LegC family aminotransferase [Solirhodobacter olei]|uniref:LegC family aminotransferase n=1 Tax=Solirhodobacter olei TaxID=2493082 RepID=UPI000FD74BB7|nr:LegC family aminotransferase [Solirhodobacter olei]
MTVRASDSRKGALIDFIQGIYGPPPITLHRPVFEGNERLYLVDSIDSNFVSSVGARVTEFEGRLAAFTGATHGIAAVNGTAALHTALLLVGVERGDEVISQALTFVATCNAINYIGARAVFVDVDRDTLGMSPEALRSWLETNTRCEGGRTVNVATGARIKACVPMHTFGIPCRIEMIAEICAEFGIALVEDTAESLGSYVGKKHTGTFGQIAAFSFNGNKIITTGGGGMIVTNDGEIARRARHLTTTAKRPHRYEFFHDEVGYNYRLPNLNAALGCAQMEVLPAMLKIKAEVAARYRAFCSEQGLHFIEAPAGTTSNNWLNAILFDDRAARDDFLKFSNETGVMTRPIWRLMTELPMFAECQQDGLEQARWLVDRVVNLPSSVPQSEFERLKP